MSKNNKKSNRKDIVQIGYSGASYKYDEKQFIINFRFKGGLGKNEEELESYSDLDVFEFTVNSYAQSALHLLKNFKLYDKELAISNLKYICKFFLPGMFCFRHYLELRIKSYYSKITKKTYSTIHDLEKLKNEVNSERKTPISLFNKAIALVDKYEKGCVEFFRYMSDKEFNIVGTLEIDVSIYDKVKNLYLEIEHRLSNISFSEDFFHSKK